MTLPTFLLVGAPRAGTTSLHRWLAGHPDVCMSRPKETQYFTLHHQLGVQHYAGYFSHHRGEPAVGESTPMYLAMPEVPARIAGLLPDVRLVAVLREPLALVVSTWSKLRSLGVERRPLDVAVRDDLCRPEPDDAEAERTWRTVIAAADEGRPVTRIPYLLLGRYEDALRRYLRHFPREQLAVLLHEELVRAPSAFAAEVCAAVGIDPARAPTPAPERVNESVGPRQGWVRRHVRRVRSSRARRGAEWLAARLDPAAAPALDPGLARELRDLFAQANCGLGDLLGRDLPAWGGGVQVR